MKIEDIPVTLRKITPSKPENWLTNGETYSKLVYLGKEDNPDNWHEITQEQYEEIVGEY